MSTDAILASLELVADRVGDPTALVYERLFAAAPEMRALTRRIELLRGVFARNAEPTRRSTMW